MLSLLIVVFLIFALICEGFYIPGTAPVDYEEGAEMEVFGTKLYSLKSQLPKDYYSAPFCVVSDENRSKKKKYHASLGSLLEGERKELTLYTFNMNVDEKCRVLCARDLRKNEFRSIMSLARDEYLVRLSLDNMPLITKGENNDESEYFVLGYPLFTKSEEKGVLLNNHISFKVLIHRPKFSASDLSQLGGSGEFFRVVGFEAIATSVKHTVGTDNVVKTCTAEGLDTSGGPLTVKSVTGASDGAGGKDPIIYTYDISFEESAISWATRWDHLLKVDSSFRKVQWFSIINSCLIVFFLTLLVALVLLRTVWRDFARYNNLDNLEEVRDESGWKTVNGDVFRAPFLMELLAVFCGTGVQLIVVTVATLLFALLGFFSPANRGGLLTGMLVFWAFSSVCNGFAGARLYTFLEGTRRNTVTWLSAVGLSGFAFGIFFLLNVIAMFLHSTDAVPFFSLLLIVGMWFGISVPLAYVGSFLGYKLEKREAPCRTNSVPREIPKYSAIPPSVFTILAGILPFGVIFIQLVFILNSIWQGQLYYMFGFLFLVFVLLSITASETSIVITYLTLVSEDYLWWWKSFFASGSIGIYVFLYSIIFLVTQPMLREMHGVSIGIYVAYMLLISIATMILVGTIGFYASFLFVLNIYSSIHVD
eukprot:CAMPEP_0182441766 /NCGR_PEP_ID=MMETSP1172-20130603/771_1 /TAXON_ID=708627 /ORGANISM="Timspurckia oligopyrenoides, Strain CCMP3278" /LENGTH=647 /DNA_ID=CAMNT_0024636293 /DNA_START=117 /DNA_END=2060 /DNA_ORIENTATION=-